MDTSENIPAQIAGYTVFALSIPPLPSFPVSAVHYLYVVPHQPKIQSPTASRSLFLTHIPFDSTDLHFKTLFSTQLGLPSGRIEDVEFDGRSNRNGSAESTAPHEANPKKRKRSKERDYEKDLEAAAALPAVWDRELQSNGRTAVVRFVDRASMEAALKAIKTARKQKSNPIWGEGVEAKLAPLGSARYLKHHELLFPDKAKMLENVNKYMTAYAAREDAQKKLEASKRQEPDQDGFITVGRVGKSNATKQEAVQALAAKQKEKQKGLEDFYRFQSREKRKERAGELRRKFDEDREKIRQMREKRGKLMPE